VIILFFLSRGGREGKSDPHPIFFESPSEEGNNAGKRRKEVRFLIISPGGRKRGRIEFHHNQLYRGEGRKQERKKKEKRGEKREGRHNIFA